MGDDVSRKDEIYEVLVREADMDGLVIISQQYIAEQLGMTYFKSINVFINQLAADGKLKKMGTHREHAARQGNWGMYQLLGEDYD
jgi:hypothetical protein